MGKREEYSKELQNKKWLTKRDKILALSKYKCSNCKLKTSLEVHHLYYIEDHKAWEYPNNALVVLCRHCHQAWHDTHDIEVRSKKWSKNKKYDVPVKPKVKCKKKLWNKVKSEIKDTFTKNHTVDVKVTLKLSPLEKRKRSIQNNKKEQLFKEVGFEIKGEIKTLLKRFTLDETKEYLDKLRTNDIV